MDYKQLFQIDPITSLFLTIDIKRISQFLLHTLSDKSIFPCVLHRKEHKNIYIVILAYTVSISLQNILLLLVYNGFFLLNVAKPFCDNNIWETRIHNVMMLIDTI